MRPLEIFSGIALVVYAVIVLLGRNWRAASMSLAVLTLAAILAHLLIEGARLQAAPFYLAMLLVVLLASNFGSWHVRLLAAAGIGVAAMAGIVLCYAVPVFQLPPVSGPFAIGSTTIAFTDSSREETNLPAPYQPRRFMAEIWYPASECTGRHAAYRDFRTLRTWKSAHLRYIKTHSCVDAPVLPSKVKWPLVFFSPSSGGYRSQNTFLVEELVSHGYVVVGMDHPYSSSRVAFPDGSVAYTDPQKNGWLNIESKAEWAASLPRVEAMLDVNVRDIQFAYQQMQQGRLNGKAAEILRGVDFERTAVMGHSFGGAAAAELCRIDPRFVAGINLDGWMFHDFRTTGIDKPFLFVIEDDPTWFKNDGPYGDDLDGVARLGAKDFHDSIRASVRRWGGYILRPVGAAEEDLSDIVLFLRWPVGNKRPNPEPTLQLIRKVTLAFLNQYLKHERSPLLATSALTATYELQVSPGPVLSAAGRF